MGRRSRCSWFCRGILHGFLRLRGFPYRIQCHLQESGWVGILADNHKIRILSLQHPRLSRLVQLLKTEKKDILKEKFVKSVLNCNISEKRSDVWENKIRQIIFKGQTNLKGVFTFCVVAFGPVVSSSRLSKNKVVRSKYLSVGSRSHGVHGSRFKIDEYCTGNIFATRGFIIINVDAFQLEVAVSVISTGRVNSVLVGDDFPKLEKKN